MTDRKTVFAAIETERSFQNHLLEQGRPDMRPDLQIGSSILAMEENLSKAREAWYRDHGDYAHTMTYLRKVAGLIIQIAEVHGMPERELPQTEPEPGPEVPCNWVSDGTGGGHRGEYDFTCLTCGKTDWFARYDLPEKDYKPNDCPVPSDG